MKKFLFELGDKVKMTHSKESGDIIGRSEYVNSGNSYLVRYCSGDGRQVENWMTEDGLLAA